MVTLVPGRTRLPPDTLIDSGPSGRWRRRERPSLSTRPKPVPPSSALWTRRSSPPAPPRPPTGLWPSALTPSRSRPPTSPPTPTRARRVGSGSWTPRAAPKCWWGPGTSPRAPDRKTRPPLRFSDPRDRRHIGGQRLSEGDRQDLQQLLRPSWGTQKARTKPAIGNHEYSSRGARLLRLLRCCRRHEWLLQL